MHKTFSAPMATIKIGNKTAGYCRSLSFSENVTRANVQGLGSLTKQEVPPVAYDCQFTVDQFFLDLKAPVMEAMVKRLGSVKAVIDTLVLGETGFTIALYKKTIMTQDGTTGIVQASDPTGETMAELGPCFVNNQQFQLQEGGVAGFNTTGVYLSPISTLNL